MGIRQTAQPLGVRVGALVIPRLAESHGISVALLFPALVCAVSAVVCAVAVIDPPRPARAEAGRAGAGQPVPGIGGVVAHPRGLGAACRSAGDGMDVHAGVVDE